MSDPLVRFMEEYVANRQLTNAETEYWRPVWMGPGVRGRDWAAYDYAINRLDGETERNFLRRARERNRNDDIGYRFSRSLNHPSWLHRDVIRVPNLYQEEVLGRAAIMKTDWPDSLPFSQFACVVEILWGYHRGYAALANAESRRRQDQSSDCPDGTLPGVSERGD